MFINIFSVSSLLTMMTIIMIFDYHRHHHCTLAQQVSPFARQLAELNDEEHFRRVLSEILIPRVVGSNGHERVSKFIANELESLGLTTEFDQFVARTPLFGNLTFTNIIGYFNPDAEKFLTLACHYDSKYFADNPDFVGAIDSAVPCSLMLNVIKVLLPLLEQHRTRSDIGLMLVFFDGEEAFLEWSALDSIYGSRHLAQKLSGRRSMIRGSRIRDIDRIEVLVLLDLIGAANSKYYNFYENTALLHRALVKIERTLSKGQLLEGHNYAFIPKTAYSFVDDDHRPFLEKDVPILHLITVPFPSQWHKPTDNAENLHWPSIRNFNKVLRIFVFEYLSKHTNEVNFRV